MKMPAVSAMVVNGDISTQLARASPGQSVRGVVPYEDEHCRARMRLLWG
jgi:hypothetical protein